MGLLSGLSDMGLGKLEKAEIYSEEEVKPNNNKEVPAEKAKEPFNESDALFDKKCECPVCNKAFTYRAVRSGKIKLVSQDPDLRPKYDKFDPAKYDVIVCPSCGYAVLAKYFQPLAAAHIKLVKENICGKVRGIENKNVLSYDDAIKRYQLALATAIVKRTKDSEKAYICLKMAWLIRGKKEEIQENMMDDNPDYDKIMAGLRADENEALNSAFEGFITARQKETFPMAGMDELTVDYLLAVLATRFQHYDIAQKLISSILSSRVANNRIKDKARDLREQVKMDMAMNSNQ